MDILHQQFRVPEIYGDYWFNSDPIPLGALRGYVILIDFWDYSCLPCLRTLPYVQEWNRRYADKGLITIGVHTPQFPFARDPINVRQAVEKLGIKYPVVMDNDFIVWGSFRNMVWPTKYLVDKHGFFKYVHAGEGSYQNFEHAIQSLLADAGYHAEFPIVMDPIRESDRPGVVCYRATPEILAGWQRGTLGNVEGFSPESTIHYEDPGYHLDGRLYLQGNWYNDRSFLKLEETDGKEGYLVFSYQAKEVNAVIKPEGEKNFQVFVHQDDRFMTTTDKGDDVLIDEGGRSYLLIDQPRLYNLAKNKEFGEHTLKLTTRSNGFALYDISFISSVIPEMISEN
ncbi:MAG: redoxin domain-containing protein [Ignavibacteria bacterium]|nr:redoxin domain-containing protein [Ignavibacteria bacterium]MBI3764979.1 redoxin domain-containing protein [Ignavibacteriales bacterium]